MLLFSSCCCCYCYPLLRGFSQSACGSRAAYVDNIDYVCSPQFVFLVANCRRCFFILDVTGIMMGTNILQTMHAKLLSAQLEGSGYGDEQQSLGLRPGGTIYVIYDVYASCACLAYGRFKG